MATELTLPEYYHASDPRGDSIAMRVYGVVVAIDDENETFAFEFPSTFLGGVIRIIDQPLALDYDVHAGGSVCQRCGRPIRQDPFHGKQVGANYCVGVEYCYQQFTPLPESQLDIGDFVSVHITKEAANQVRG